MMMGDKTSEEFQRRRSLTTQHPALHHPERPVTLHGLLPGETAGLDEQQTTSSMEAFGLDILKEEDEGGQIQYVFFLPTITCKTSDHMFLLNDSKVLNVEHQNLVLLLSCVTFKCW